MCFRGERVILGILSLILWCIVIVNRKSYASVSVMSLTILPAVSSSWTVSLSWTISTWTETLTTDNGDHSDNQETWWLQGNNNTTSIQLKDNNLNTKIEVTKSGYMYLSSTTGSQATFAWLLSTLSATAKVKSFVFVQKDKKQCQGCGKICTRFWKSGRQARYWPALWLCYLRSYTPASNA